MHELVNNLELYREYVQNNKNTELFVALSDCYYINCVDNFVDFQHKNTKGMGLRKFNRNSTDFMCCDGISLESLELFQKKVVPSNHFPPAKIIPFQKNNFTPCNYQDISAYTGPAAPSARNFSPTQPEGSPTPRK